MKYCTVSQAAAVLKVSRIRIYKIIDKFEGVIKDEVTGIILIPVDSVKSLKIHPRSNLAKKQVEKIRTLPCKEIER